MGKGIKESAVEMIERCVVWRQVLALPNLTYSSPRRNYEFWTLPVVSTSCVIFDAGHNNIVKILMILPFPTWIYFLTSSWFEQILFCFHHSQDRNVRTETQWPQLQPKQWSLSKRDNVWVCWWGWVTDMQCLGEIKRMWDIKIHEQKMTPFPTNFPNRRKEWWKRH